MKNQKIVEAMPGYRWEIDEENFVKVVYCQNADLVVFSDQGIGRYLADGEGETLLDFLESKSLADVGTVKNGGWLNLTPSVLIPWNLATATTNTAADSATSAPSTQAMSYTFRVLNNDGTEFGKGCFTLGNGSESSVEYRRGTAETLTAFWYRDPIVGVLDLSALLSLSFSDRAGEQQFQFNAWAQPDFDRGLVAGGATPDQLGAVSAHRGGNGRRKLSRAQAGVGGDRAAHDRSH